MIASLKKPAGLAEAAYQHLKQLILEATLPPGDTIYEPQLAKAFGISRTPIREAMIRLNQEGWLQSARGTGYVVRQLTRSEIDDIYEMRMMLEQRAILQFASRISDEQIENLKTDLEQGEAKVAEGNYDLFLSINRELHQEFVVSCENEILKTALTNLGERMYRIRKFTGTDKNRHIGGAMQEQRAIADALIKRDADAAGQALITHLEAARSRILAQLEALDNHPPDSGGHS